MPTVLIAPMHAIEIRPPTGAYSIALAPDSSLKFAFEQNQKLAYVYYEEERGGNRLPSCADAWQATGQVGTAFSSSALCASEPSKEQIMRTLIALLALAFLAIGPASAESMVPPGHHAKATHGQPGASYYAPGHEKKRMHMQSARKVASENRTEAECEFGNA